MIQLHEVCWVNDRNPDLENALLNVGVTQQDLREANARLLRFAPFLEEAFPETKVSKGIIESPLARTNKLRDILNSQLSELPGSTLLGNVYLKLDNYLPISGSIKARGGIYEVLAHAESLGLKAGFIDTEGDYGDLRRQECRNFFSRHRIAVGSTGNLGLSVGIIGKKLGFEVDVHMSSDARDWKKKKLRDLGARVIEYKQDYSAAVLQGRKQASKDKTCFFVDDENSKTLFLGYAVAGERLKTQFQQQGIVVDADHPLFVYLPCGVGGGPGGITFGLKLVFGDNVYCIFAEPTHSPSMLLGIHTGLYHEICVQDIGIDNKTEADGLAVGRPSSFVSQAMGKIIDGFYTVSDTHMFDWLKLLSQIENITIEPSAAAAIGGPITIGRKIMQENRMGITPELFSQSTHVIWATGGGMVPEEQIAKYLE